MLKKRTQRGQGAIEMLMGTFIIVPVALFMLDLGSLVLCHEVNDAMAKRTARVAANLAPESKEKITEEVKKVVGQCPTNSLIQQVTLKWLDYNKGQVTDGSAPSQSVAPESGQVIVVTEMTVKLPVPLPFVPEANQTATFMAQHVEPIVALPPSSNDL